MEDNFIPPVKCPYCGYKMDAATGVFDGEGHSPTPGSISICLNCGKVAVFTEELGMRLPTPEEAIEFATDERIIKAQITQAAVVTKDLRK
jgi:hypothetical protein